jgi:hypothetical protein
MLVPEQPTSPGDISPGTTQVGFGVRAGGALEAGQVGSYCQTQPVGERLKEEDRWALGPAQ